MEANNIEPVLYDGIYFDYTVNKVKFGGLWGGITRLSEDGKIDGNFRQDQILNGYIKMSFVDWMIYIKNLKPDSRLGKYKKK